MQKHLYKYFNLTGHTNFLDVIVTRIDKTDPSDPNER